MPTLSRYMCTVAAAAVFLVALAAAQTAAGGGHANCADTGIAHGNGHGLAPDRGQMTQAEWIALRDQALLNALSDSAQCMDAAFQSGQDTIATVPGGRPQVVLKRDRRGHYSARGHINQQPVDFLLDTGATVVAIPQHIALSLGLKHGAAIASVTANGTVQTYATRLDSIGIGAIELHNVAASINPHSATDEILLGMSFLRQLELTQRGDTLTLRQ